MTAEVAILNKEAVAIAADSAVTMRDEKGQKIFSSANKVFALTKHAPIGIMVYGNASFMDVPWETVIKTYRAKLGKKKFKRLEQYAGDFIRFLETDRQFSPAEEQEKYVRANVFSYFRSIIRSEIEEEIKRLLDKNGEVKEREVRTICKNVIDTYSSSWNSAESMFKTKKKEQEEAKKLRDKYKLVIEQGIKIVFEKLPITKKYKDILFEIAVLLFIRFPHDGLSYGGVAGVVVTGFGEDDVFPAIQSFSINGVANNLLKLKVEDVDRVDYNNSSFIVPFAQSDMVITFMEGINPELNNIMTQLLFETLKNYPNVIVESLKGVSKKKKNELKDELQKAGKKMLQKHLKRLDEFKKDNFVHPVLEVVAALPKDELGAMAEALINLTIFKRRISRDDETVGPPIDVAVISKGDGLIWINRKHYFKPELNHQFSGNH